LVFNYSVPKATTVPYWYSKHAIPLSKSFFYRPQTIEACHHVWGW
jgi:hypothetical protein